MNPKPVARFLDVSEQKAVVAYLEPVHKLLRKKATALIQAMTVDATRGSGVVLAR
jgi:hypothetical protein